MESSRLSDYTTFQLGGPCTGVVGCPDEATLVSTIKALADANIAYMVIGQGSNLLVSDGGVDCVVLRYCSDTIPNVRIAGETIDVSGNTLLDDLTSIAIEKGVGDLSFCSGIPGTVGGAIVGNAGAFGRQIGDLVAAVDIVERDGFRHQVMADGLDFGYRTSRLKETGGIVISAHLKVEKHKRSEMLAERKRILELRRTKHPNWREMPCAGSIFRNIEPSSAAQRRQAAGWFLEQAGAKEFVVGGAHLFAKHANIIIADSGATAADVYHLMEKMVAAVDKKFGMQLQREIKLVGDF